MRRPIQIGFIGAMSVVAFLAIVVVISGLVAVTSRLDQASKHREESVVANGLNGHIKEIAQMVVPQADWDDAVKYLDGRFDRSWAQQNIGQFLGGTDGFEGAIVLGADDKPIYGWINGAEPANPMAYNAFTVAGETSIAKVRAAETARPPLAGRKPVDGLLTPPIQTADIRIVGGQPYVLTATLVQPDFGRSMPPPRSAIVLTAQAIDAAFLKDFANRYMMDGLHLAPANAPAATSFKVASVPLRASDGGAVAIMRWTPQSPGAQLRNHVAPAILGLGVCMLALVIVLNRKARKAAHGLVASEARAKHMAVHDALTGLPNRTLFNDRLGLALDTSRRTGSHVAVLIVDLDRFKEVNDTFGHHCGDELIREAAKRLASTVRANETLARLGGDEFAVVQPEATAATAAALAERIRLVVSGPVDISAGRVHLACSSGVAVTHGGNIEPGEVLRQADLALYRAKERRRGGYCFFEPEMDAALRTRKALEADLREAIETEQLQMVYQPQVNGRGKVVGVEALVRWTHPIRGQVSPAYFVPIAEECGLIEQLGFYTLRKAFTDSRRRPKL
ncbi:MAG: CHASE4-family protein, partial [Caulobacteraceae bacterium]|nr:CHASE4-family protein [Caulobacteraceae bacterium]